MFVLNKLSESESESDNLETMCLRLTVAIIFI